MNITTDFNFKLKTGSRVKMCDRNHSWKQSCEIKLRNNIVKSWNCECLKLWNCQKIVRICNNVKNCESLTVKFCDREISILWNCKHVKFWNCDCENSFFFFEKHCEFQKLCKLASWLWKFPISPHKLPSRELRNLESLTPIREFWTKNPISGNWASVSSG